MPTPLSRRRVLRLGTIGATVLSAGCTQLLPGTDYDVVVRNEDDVDHEVVVSLDRGTAYSLENGSAEVKAGGESQIPNLIDRSDWPYPYLLRIRVDGQHVATTEHRASDDVQLTIRPDGTVTADETTRPAPITTHDLNGPDSAE